MRAHACVQCRRWAAGSQGPSEKQPHRGRERVNAPHDDGGALATDTVRGTSTLPSKPQGARAGLWFGPAWPWASVRGVAASCGWAWAAGSLSTRPPLCSLSLSLLKHKWSGFVTSFPVCVLRRGQRCVALPSGEWGVRRAGKHHAQYVCSRFPSAFIHSPPGVTILADYVTRKPPESRGVRLTAERGAAPSSHHHLAARPAAAADGHLP